MKKYLLALFIFSLLAISIPAFAQDTSTNEADIRQKIIKKVQEVLEKPKAYIGVVTDISGGTIQIKTQAGQIQQVSANPDSLTVIKVGKTNKEIKLTDIAIGDFIVALGFKNGNNVLDARRILTMSPLTEPGILLLYGGVTKVEKKDIILTQLKSREQTKILIDLDTDILVQKGQKKVTIKLSDLNEGDLIIAVISKDTSKARTIFVITPTPSTSPLPTGK